MMLLLANNLSLPKDDTFQWMVVCVGVLATIYLVMRPKFHRRRDPMEHDQGSGLSLAQQRQIERDLQRLMVEMLDTARQMTAQLDTRAAKLEILLREADKKLATFSADPAKRAPEPAEAAKSDSDATNSGIESPVHPDEKETPPNPRHADIYEMADQGQTAPEIARHLGRPSGEVELILALRPRVPTA